VDFICNRGLNFIEKKTFRRHLKSNGSMKNEMAKHADSFCRRTMKQLAPLEVEKYTVESSKFKARGILQKKAMIQCSQ
jgi:hypothetical protein